MASLQSQQYRVLASTGTVISAGTDTPVAFRIRKLGSETATSVTVTTATNIVLVGSTTTDTITFATYTTYGSVIDAINATGRWEAKAMDALRSKASASTLVTGAITAGTDGNGLVVWDATVDTSTALQICVGLLPSRDFDAPSAKRVHLLEAKYSVDMGTAAANSFQIWLRRGKTETQLLGELSVDTTATTYTFASGLGKISGRDGDEIIVLVKDAATLADATGNYVRLSGIVE